MAAGLVGRLGDAVTLFPRYILTEIRETLASLGIAQDQIPSGIDNLKYGSTFMTTLDSLPLRAEVPYHLASIKASDPH